MHPVSHFIAKIYSKSRLRLQQASLSGAFGGKYTNILHHPDWFSYVIGPGLLASAIIQMEGVGGLSGWQWIFVSSSSLFKHKSAEIVRSLRALQPSLLLS